MRTHSRTNTHTHTHTGKLLLNSWESIGWLALRQGESQGTACHINTTLKQRHAMTRHSMPVRVHHLCVCVCVCVCVSLRVCVTDITWQLRCMWRTAYPAQVATLATGSNYGTFINVVFESIKTCFQFHTAGTPSELRTNCLFPCPIYVRFCEARQRRLLVGCLSGRFEGHTGEKFQEIYENKKTNS